MNPALSLAALVLAAVPAVACLHGATGKESTTVVEGRERTDRLVIDARSETVVKVFVGPRGLGPGKGISGEALSDEEKQLHARLGARAAGIATEGLRSLSKSIGFSGSAVTGQIEALTEAKTWAEARAKAGLPESPDDQRYEQWFSRVKSSGRGLYALKLALNGERNPEVALKITYSDAGHILGDKWLEAGAGLGAPSIVYFPGGDAAALSRTAAQATGLPFTEKANAPGSYDTGGFRAEARIRPFDRDDASKGPVVWFATGPGR